MTSVYISNMYKKELFEDVMTCKFISDMYKKLFEDVVTLSFD